MLHKLIMDIPRHITNEIKSLDLGIETPEKNSDIEYLLQNTVLSGGKRLRPLLCFLMADVFGISSDEIAPYARAIELVHAASLTHDDVVDSATLRRGRPSINIVSSNKKAVLAGDYLLADVIVSLTKRGNLKLVTEMALIIQQLAEGEWLQLQMSVSRNYSESGVENIAKLKTASVMSWCSITPAILSNSSDDLIKVCRNFGQNLGIAFQLIDDTIDFKTDSKKDSNIDFANGIINSVTYEFFKNEEQLFNDYKSGKEIDLNLYKKQLEVAANRVRLKAKDCLTNAKNDLNMIFERAKGNERTLKPLLLILDFLAKRGQ